MSIFHNSGNRRENFKNQFKIPREERGKFDFFSHASKRDIYSNKEIYSRYCGGWQKAFDRRDIRIATKNKVPLRRGWPNCYERLRAEELLRKYGEWGTRTGKRVGNKYYVRLDLDLAELPWAIKETLDKGFNLLISRQNIIFIKTKKGYHVISLLDELPPNGVIYHIDKFGVKRKVGDILALGRQAQELGSPDKEPVGKGKWAWQAKTIEAIAEVFAKYFFILECKPKKLANQKAGVLKNELEGDFKVNGEEKIKWKEVNNINLSEVEKSSQNLNQNTYKLLKLEKVKITSKQTTKRANHYRVSYMDKYQNRGFFFLDSYFRDKREVIQPNLIGNFLLVRGYKYQFFVAFA